MSNKHLKASGFAVVPPLLFSILEKGEEWVLKGLFKILLGSISFFLLLDEVR
jgi:hypothetical protein